MRGKVHCVIYKATLLHNQLLALHDEIIDSLVGLKQMRDLAMREKKLYVVPPSMG